MLSVSLSSLNIQFKMYAECVLKFIKYKNPNWINTPSSDIYVLSKNINFIGLTLHLSKNINFIGLTLLD